MTSVSPSVATIVDTGSPQFTLTVAFSHAMDTTHSPTITFPTAGEESHGLSGHADFQFRQLVERDDLRGHL